MAKRKRQSTPTSSAKRRKYAKRRRQRIKYSKRSLPLAGNPRCKLVKLRYAETIAINAPIGGVGSYVFRANDLYDPNYTGTGHQPLGFDQLMQYYNHFTVIGSKCTVMFTPSSGVGGLTPGLLGVALSDGGVTVSGYANTNHLLEGRQTGMKTMWLGDPASMGSRRSVVKTFSHNKFFCRPSTNTEFKGNVGGSPQETAFYEVFVASVNSNDPASMILTVVIDYIALMSEPRDLPQS